MGRVLTRFLVSEGANGRSLSAGLSSRKDSTASSMSPAGCCVIHRWDQRAGSDA